MSPALATMIAMIEQIGFALLVVALVLSCWSDIRIGLLRLRSPRVFFGLALFLVVGITSVGIDALGWYLPLLPFSLAFAAVFGLLSPRFALCFATGALLMRPWEILPKNDFLEVLPRGLALLLVGVGLLRIRGVREWKVLVRPEDIGILGFAFVSYLSTFVAPSLAISQEQWMLTFSKSLMLYALIRLFAKTRADVGALCLTLGIAGMTLVAITLYRLEADPKLAMPGSRAELFGLIGDPNDLAATILLASPLLMGELRSWIPWKALRWLFIGALSVLAIWVVIQTQSRGAFIGVLAAIGAAIFVWLRDTRRILMTLPLVIVLGGALLMKTLNRSSDDLSASSSSRMAYWVAGWRMAIRHPLTGVGYEAYPLRFEQYADASKVEGKLRTAHSSWVLALAETGFIGFTLLIFGVLGAYWRVFKRRFEEPALFVAYTGYFAAATFLSHTYILHPYILIGIALCARIEEEKA
jgi:hypothetical protein